MGDADGQGLVRPATAEDVLGIATVHVRSWNETYSHLLSPERLARITVEGRAAFWAGEVAAGTHAVLVAVRDDRVVGFANAGPGRDDDAPAALELYAIYLLASEHGSGLGQRLVDAALGSRSAYLWVAEDNPRAQSFYRRNGFAVRGQPKDGTVREVMMARGRVG